MNRLIILVLLTFFVSLLPARERAECLDCHSDNEITKTIDDSIEVSVYVDSTILENSVHEGFECTDCHKPGDDHPDETALPAVRCGGCHEDAATEYARSIHALAHLNGKVHTARCTDCHGTHNILSADDKNSSVSKDNLGHTCGVCHSRPDVMKLIGQRGEGPVKDYQQSIHGRSRATDVNSKAPVCSNCHNYHAILPRTDPKCSYTKVNIPATCGKCHPKEEKSYRESIHWNAILRGHYEAPTCNDCHSEHNIQPAEGINSVTSTKMQATKLCANCHASKTLMERFGLDARRLDSYMKSYHGLAVLKGSPEAATCTSCHEVHAIRGTQDSLSSVQYSNRIATCGHCHKNITKEFASIEVHPLDQKTRNPIAYFFRMMYIWLIIIVIAGMFLHNFIILLYHIREKRKVELGQLRITRFQSWEVYQHLFMLTSFILLVITGFALKFPNADWVQMLVSIGFDERIRPIVHRISAVVMLTTSIIQLGYFIFNHRGRKDFLSLLPTRDDLIHLWQNMRFHLGISEERPQFGRYDYGEKAEYLALIWGVLVMGATGFVLWFPEFFIGFLPSWLFETSEVIHYFEAWLATLAIVIWHWFFVIYHPDIYPLNTTVFDGKITEDNIKHDHPMEYAELQKKSEK